MAYVIANAPQAGLQDLIGVYVGTTALGAPGVGMLPSVPFGAQLGQIVQAYDTAANAASVGAGGFGEFILLAVPVSTAVVAKLFYYFNPSTYGIILVPTTLSATTTSGAPLALAIQAVSSDASNVQYAWFQVGGRGTALKEAVAATPNVPIYASATTAGRVRVAGSAFRAIIGARTANATTVASGTSTVAVYLNRPTLTAGI